MYNVISLYHSVQYNVVAMLRSSASWHNELRCLKSHRARAAGIINQVTSALAFVHAKGILRIPIFTGHLTSACALHHKQQKARMLSTGGALRILSGTESGHKHELSTHLTYFEITL